MPRTKSLFNVTRLVKESGTEASPEASFLMDLDYTLRKLNEHTPHHYFKKINQEDNPEYFDAQGKMVNVVCIDSLPESCTEEHDYEKTHIIYHTNDGNYYIGKYSDGKPSRRYKPSSLHCIRQMYYQMIGADLDKQSPKTGDFYGICESGSDRHERIQNAIKHMKQSGVDCEYISVSDYVNSVDLDLKVLEVREYETKLLDEENNIVFLCDGIIRYKGKLYILEIKTESSYKWMNRAGVDPHHKNQASTYSLEFGINDVLFIYENRDICTKKSYILHVEPENKQYILDRIKNCNEYISNNTTPPKEESVDKKVCQYCEYRTKCKVDK